MPADSEESRGDRPGLRSQRLPPRGLRFGDAELVELRSSGLRPRFLITSSRMPLPAARGVLKFCDNLLERFVAL
jgi:hypothetical protein